MDRKDLIETLFNNLRDKTKVHTSREVTTIDVLESKVVLKTKDGAVIEGSVVVGADGVHSCVRSELWRMAREATPGDISEKEVKGTA